MDEKDSLIFFKSRDEKWLEKEIIGDEKASVSNFYSVDLKNDWGLRE